MIQKFKESYSEEIQIKLIAEKLKAETSKNEKFIFDMMKLWDKREEESLDKDDPTEVKIEKLQLEIKDLKENTEMEVFDAMSVLSSQNLKILI